MTEYDWARTGIEIAVALVSGAAGAIGTAYSFGKTDATERAQLKEEMDARIDDLRDKTVGKMDQAIKAADARNELLISQIRETLDGMRRQFDEYRVEIEREFFRKIDFNQFFTAYRDDQNRINDKLDRILAGPPKSTK